MNKKEWRLWSLWVSLYFFHALFIIFSFNSSYSDALILLFLVTYIIGQWLILRPHFSPPFKWVWASLVAFILMGLISATVEIFNFWTLLPPISTIVRVTIEEVLLASVLGIMQWLVLRRHVHMAGIWIIGVMLGTFVATLFADINWLLGSAADGVITATILIWLMRRPIINDPVEDNTLEELEQ